MDYIESQGKANPWKIYCSMDWYFYGLYMPHKIIKSWYLYISQIFKNYGFHLFHIFQKYGLLKENTSFLKPFKMPLNQRLKSFFIFLTS